MKIPRGLQPLIDDGIVDAVLRQLKSGKEASVFLVDCGGQLRCAKVYKDAEHRGFHKLAAYQEGRKARGGILDALDLQAGHRHRLDDFVERGLGFQVLFQPGQGEFHQLNPVARFGWISAGKL